MKTETDRDNALAAAEAVVIEKEESSVALVVYGDNPAELVLPKDMPKQDYFVYGRKLGLVMEFGAWRVGDYVNYGMTVYGFKDYEEIARATGLSEQFLRNCASVAGRVSLEFRHFGLEKMRLMLNRKGEKESIKRLVKRLGDKTHAELRKMAASGNGGDGDGNDETSATATEVYEAAQRLHESLETFDSNTKLAALASFENDTDTGGALLATCRFLGALIDQLNAEFPKKE